MHSLDLNKIGQQWIDAAAHKRQFKVLSMLDKSVILNPPFMEERVSGMANVCGIFLAFSGLTTNFHYGRILHNDHPNQNRELILEFKTDIEGKTMHAADFIKLNDKGQIIEMKVVARSPEAVKALGKAAHNMPFLLKLRISASKALINFYLKFRS